MLSATAHRRGSSHNPPISAHIARPCAGAQGAWHEPSVRTAIFMEFLYR